MVKPRWEVKIGTPVIATDGEYGYLRQVILDPHQERIVALIVRQHGLVASHSVVVPVEEVADATESEVRLKISQAQVDVLPEFKADNGLVVQDRKYEVDGESFAVRGTQGLEVGRAPTARRPGMLESQITQPERDRLAFQLRAGHKVICRDGHAGKVSLMLLDPMGWVKGFVMHAGHLPGRNLIVPVAWVQEVDKENVYLSIKKDILENLHDYSPDDVLATGVENALWADDILRVTDYNQINITVENGIVILQGHVVTVINQARAEYAARLVPGVLGVENHLVVDNDLEIDVAQALGHDQRTRLEGVCVAAQNGVISLTGRVGSADVREAAEEVAASVPQVRGVANFIDAPQVVVDPEEQRVLQPPIGREVYATDMLLGDVEKVIIDPHNRRVTDFVVHGEFPDLQHAGEYEVLGENTQQERRVLESIRGVYYETDSSVLLDVSGREAAREHDFDPADFVSPPASWQPPYPYRWEDVLFERKVS
jgi:osmotically-inducible protein OsmY/sporulation protein YlmC with PRC-barrel domain